MEKDNNRGWRNKLKIEILVSIIMTYQKLHNQQSELALPV